MSDFNSPFENKRIKVATCLPVKNNLAKEEWGYGELIIEPEPIDGIRLYDVNGRFDITVNKHDLLEAINNSIVRGKVIE